MKSGGRFSVIGALLAGYRRVIGRLSAHGDALFGQLGLERTDGNLAVVEDARCQGGIGVPGGEHLGDVGRRARAARGASPGRDL